MEPIVSILMPVYNCVGYVNQAINSILDQTFSDFELIIYDDGSVDGTWDKICAYQDKRIRRYKNRVNVGYVETCNLLFPLVKGRYFTFQDADDWSELTRLEEQLHVFDTHNDIHLCACNGRFYYDEITQRACPPFKSDYITVTEDNYEFMLPPNMYRSEVLKQVPGFHLYFNKATGADQYFILDVLSRYKGYALNRYLYTARFNPTSNHRTFDSLRKLTTPDAYFLLKKQRVRTGKDWLSEGREDLALNFEESLTKNRTYMAEKYREYAVYKVDSDQISPAIKLILKSLSSNPFWFPTYRTLFYAFKRLVKK